MRRGPIGWVRYGWSRWETPRWIGIDREGRAWLAWRV